MRSITFRLDKRLSHTQQDVALERVRKVPGVSQAESLVPASTDSGLRRLGYAYVDDDVAIENVLKHVESLPEVEDASLPAQRGLLEHPR
jgi:hypothetical protein